MSLLSHMNKRVIEEEDAELEVFEEPSTLGMEVETQSDPVVVAHKKKKRRNVEEDKVQIAEEKEMQRLENFLFGSLYSPIEFGKNDREEDEPQKLPSGAFLDRRAIKIVSSDEVSEEGPLSCVEDLYAQDGGEMDGDTEGRKPAWVDEDDGKTTINIAKVNRLRKLRKEEDETVISGSAYVARLRAHHAKLNPGTDWARLDRKGRVYSSDEDSDREDGANLTSGYIDDILRTNDDVVVKSSKIMPGRIEYSSLGDIAAQDTPGGPINSVQFHRNAQLLLAAGYDKKLRLFQVDGKKNALIQSICLEDCPIRKASFLPDGSQAIVSGRRKFFYSIDLVKTKIDKIGPLTGREEKSLEFFEVSPDSSTIAFLGNEGYILLVSTKTKQLIGTLKMNGTARSLAFTSDGQQLLSSGGDGHIYRWDLRTRRCIDKGVDEGSINGTALCTSPVGNLFASGSASGIVNVYNSEEFIGGKRKPLKTVDNLTTQVDFMKFNHDSQVLAILSTMKKNSLKLVHIPSLTVFSGWPPKKLGYPRCVDFSPSNGLMAVGNAEKQVLLYKLHHYPNA